MSPKQWIPLESNPAVLTKFGHALGISPLLSFCDVWGLDDELLAMVPAPRYAVILLIPLTDKIQEASAQALAEDGSTTAPSSLFFCKQTIGNACGTIALLHAAINANVSVAPLTEDSFFDSFAKKTKDMDPDQCAAELHEDESLGTIHAQFAQDGQTEAPDPTEKTMLHFVCFVEHEGHLYELDGRKKAPVNHGVSSPETLLQDSAKIIKTNFMALDPTEQRFTVITLTMNVD